MIHDANKEIVRFFVPIRESIIRCDCIVQTQKVLVRAVAFRRLFVDKSAGCEI